jgi:hypothetical protein
MQPLRSLPGDQEQFPGLDARLPVAGDDVGLDHHRHPGGQRELSLRYRPARGWHHRRQVTAAEAVQQVIDRGEARLPDDRGGSREIPGPLPD